MLTSDVSLCLRKMRTGRLQSPARTELAPNFGSKLAPLTFAEEKETSIGNPTAPIPEDTMLTLVND